MPLQISTARRDPPTPAQNLYSFTRTATFGQWLVAAQSFWDDPKTTLADMAEYGRLDRYFLLVYLLNRHDALHPWLYARCREVEAEPYAYLDLWSRGAYKSTIITFCGSIQEILKDPEIKIVIFSHVRGIALEFMDQIKNELESNGRLKKMYPDVLYENPKKQSPQWSLEGITVKRKTNPKEATVMAFGLVNGMPTGGHWDLRIYDDVVTEDSVTNPEQIQKTMQRLELSWNLGTHKDNDREQYIGTRYSYGDAYQSLEERGAVKVRKYPATDNGMLDGQPVFMSKEKWERMKQVTSIRNLACLRGDTKILMADWTQKPISEIQLGDRVVGVGQEPGKYPNGRSKRSRLMVATVTDLGSRVEEINRYDFESGNHVYATPDHKWWTGRPLSGEALKPNGHKAYRTLALPPPTGGRGRKDGMYQVRRVIDPEPEVLTEQQKKAAAWLGGIFDGEGSIASYKDEKKRLGGGYLCITQSITHNPEVCARIEETLTLLGLEWMCYDYTKKGRTAYMYRISGGRNETYRFLTMCDPAKREKITRILNTGTNFGYRGKGKNSGDRVTAITPTGRGRVFSMTTTTGNYIANGAVSKNCQQLLDPLQGGDQTFSMDMLRFYELRPLTLNVYIVCDPARTKKKTSNRTGIAAVGIDHAWNRYLLDGLCHRLSLSERWKWIRHYRKKWMAARGVQLVKVGYEVYGAHADLDHFQTMMELDGDYFPIEEVKWHREGPDSHIDRVQRLEPDMRGGRYYFPYDELIPEMEFRKRKMTLEDTHGRHKGGYFVKTSLQRQAEQNGSPEMVARPIIQRDEDNQTYNLVEWMTKNELIYFPNIHVDWLDCLSRIYDMDTAAPTKRSEGELTPAPEPEY